MLNARLKFLDNSAHLYSTFAPATSAHLILERITVAGNDENTPSKRATANVACIACGTIRIPGRTSRTTIVDPTKSKEVSPKRKKNRQSTETGKRPAEKQVVVECLTCRRKTKTPLQTSQEHRVSRQRDSNAAATSGTTSTRSTLSSALAVGNLAPVSQKPVSANSSSKKRAKSRKQGGLQAMLEKSKRTGSSSSPVLDLMDLMKQA